MSESEEWITQKEASDLRGVSLPSITELVSRGRLRSKTVYGKRLVNRSDVLEFERAKPNKVSKSKPKPSKQSSKAKRK